ncbi:MAG: hypothetical protein QW575_06865 [Thermoproteota archaeon]
MSEERAERKGGEDWERSQLSTLPVNPLIVQENLIRKLYLELKKEDISEIKSFMEDDERKIYESASELHKSILTRSLSLGQLTITIINKKTLRASVMISIMGYLNELITKSKSITNRIEELTRLIKDPAISLDEKKKLYNELYEKLLKLVSIPYTQTRLVKDIEGILNMNLPYDKSSDLIKKLIGYTST